MDIFTAIVSSLSLAVLVLLLLALLSLGRVLKIQAAAILTALQNGGEAEARAREITAKQINDGILAVVTRTQSLAQALQDFRGQIDAADKQRSGDFRLSADAQLKNLQILVARFETLGPLASDVISAFELEGKQRIDSHVQLAIEIKNAIQSLGVKLGDSQTNLTIGLTEEVRQLTDQIKNLKASLEDQLKF